MLKNISQNRLLTLQLQANTAATKTSQKIQQQKFPGRLQIGKYYLSLMKTQFRSGEMVHQLKALAAFAED